ncbi:TetR family transcriptional regulator [Haloactinopolyspora alba]|uniref:TetR family transcriptional regulator n=1 Tax=Haloactinopolyspora alba TaxID=648780 RepID=A0A2P8E749_9ACTN|nr:TetR-like C-terminal domain-containing protein [Haloactinopolyspora alba]PSL05257.1 TetR family transcriptional regulator [Haloactinopolyspora alba]
MPRAGLSTAAVVDAAVAVIDDAGPGGLTLAAVAAHTGVAAPSLYKHVTGLGELRTLVGARVIEEVTDRLSAAVLGRSRDDAVTALMHAYRGYVVAHPGRYAAIPPDPLRDPALADAGSKLLDVFLAVMHGYGLRDAPAVHAVRNLRSVVHGFTAIETSGGFGLAESLDDTYAQLIEMVLAGLPRSPR